MVPTWNTIYPDLPYLRMNVLQNLIFCSFRELIFSSRKWKFFESSGLRRQKHHLGWHKNQMSSKVFTTFLSYFLFFYCGNPIYRHNQNTSKITCFRNVKIFGFVSQDQCSIGDILISQKYVISMLQNHALLFESAGSSREFEIAQGCFLMFSLM